MQYSMCVWDAEASGSHVRKQAVPYLRGLDNVLWCVRSREVLARVMSNSLAGGRNYTRVLQ